MRDEIAERRHNPESNVAGDGARPYKGIVLRVSMREDNRCVEHLPEHEACAANVPIIRSITSAGRLRAAIARRAMYSTIYMLY
jgi:hypothetical protein